MIATVSPQVVQDVHDGAKVLARTILNKQSEKKKMSKPEFPGGLPSPQREVSLDALAFLRTDTSLDKAFLRRDTSLDKLDMSAFHRAGSLSSFDRTGSLSLDFLKRESSLENPSSPGDIFRLGSTGFSRGCSLENMHEWNKLIPNTPTSVRNGAGHVNGTDALTSLARMASMEMEPTKSPPKKARADTSKKIDSIPLVHRASSTECLLQACGDATSPYHTDDSVTDDEEDDGDHELRPRANSAGKKTKKSFPKPDLGIFQKAPPVPFLQSDEGSLNVPVSKRAKKAKRSELAKKEVKKGPGDAVVGDEKSSPSTVLEKKIGKLTPEQRKLAIAKFMDKRTRRKWGRKVEYQCRKNLAVQRVRVHGRFA